MIRRIGALILAACLLTTPVYAANEPVSVTTVQKSTPQNSTINGTNNGGTGVSVTISGVSGQQVVIHSIVAWCGESPYYIPEIRISDGGTTKWISPGATQNVNSVGIANHHFVPGWTGGVGNTVVVTGFTCTTVYMSIQADQF